MFRNPKDFRIARVSERNGEVKTMAEDNKVHGINVDENDSWPGKVVGTNYLYRKNDNGELILNDRDTVEMCHAMGEIDDEEYAAEIAYIDEHEEQPDYKRIQIKRGGKKLVVFFSATGNTRKLAKTLADSIDADLHEIIPEKPYTTEDLNWQDRNSRSSIEMNDKTIRPAVANSVENIDQYDTIFIGFPIWWYVAPTIICTFLEQYDLRGMTIVPFATSGSSQMGHTNKEIGPSARGANIYEGKRFPVNASKEELKAWAEQF
jgi:flavodoxin